MKTISKQYQDLLEGKMSRDNFVRNCRQQFPQFVSSVTSVNDAIKILKGKRIIGESMSSNMNPDAGKQGYNDNYDGYTLKDCPYTGMDAALWKDGWMEAETEKQMEHDEETYRRETGDADADWMGEDVNDDHRDMDPRVFKLQNQFTPVQLTNKLLQQGMQKWGSVDNVVKFVQQVFPEMDYDAILDMINAHKEAGSPTNGITDDLPFFENKKKSLNEATEKSEGRYKETIGKDQYGRFADLDNANLQTFLRALAFEISQQQGFDDKMLPSLMEKIAKKMKKDPNAYRELVTSNYADIAKQDESMKMVPVSGKNTSDKENAMEKIKGQETSKATPSKTENRKGKPEGVKEMGITPKKAKGITAVMDMPGKEKIIDQLKEAIKKSLKEDTHPKYNRGSNAHTPDGEGEVKEVRGGTITVELKDGQTKDYQVNTLNHFEKQKKEEGIMPGVDLGGSFEKMKTSMGDEQKFQDLVNKFDWYAEMSDDSSKWDTQQDMEKQMKAIAKTIGAEKAASIWNAKAPQDRQIKSNYFMEKKEKYGKLKEYLKKALKKEATKFKAGGETIFTNDAEAASKEIELKKSGVKYTKSKA
jgi:ribosome modulation factor